MSKKSVDPFADEREERITTALESRGSYVEQTLTPTTENLVALAPPGSLVPYQRIADLSDDLSLCLLEEFQGIDLLIWRFDEWEGNEMGPFLTLEVSLASDPSQGHFLVNCGGKDVMRKVKSAFAKYDGPMVASFTKKRLSSGNSFWLLS